MFGSRPEYAKFVSRSGDMFQPQCVSGTTTPLSARDVASAREAVAVVIGSS